MTFIFAPVRDLVPAELRMVRKGRPVVCGGIHMSVILQFSYWPHWEERQIVAVANLTCRDALLFLSTTPETQSEPSLFAIRWRPPVKLGKISCQDICKAPPF